MPYLGNPPAEAYSSVTKDSFSGDGSTTAFTLSVPSTTNNMRVVVENVIQDPTVAYTVSGTTLTFTSAPPTGTNNIYAVNLGPAVQTTEPPSTIANATTFSSNLTVQGAFTSVGIDDNADAIAMTIDSSENVLIGKTSTAVNDVGVIAQSNGRFFATSDGSEPGVFNRKTSDGTILSLRKDNTTVGSIGTGGGDIWVNSNTTGLTLDDTNLTVSPRNAVSSSDDTLSLGRSAVRWKNLYLSGSVYLGGTGSANALSDYEEGTYTPTFQNVTVGGYNQQAGYYTKIGNICYFQVKLDYSSLNTADTSALAISLPFTTANQSAFSGEWGLMQTGSNTGYTGGAKDSVRGNMDSSVTLGAIAGTNNSNTYDYSSGNFAATGVLFFGGWFMTA